MCCPKDGDDYKPECLARTCTTCKDNHIALTAEEIEHCQHIMGNLRCSKRFDYVEEQKTGQELCDHLNTKQPGYPACHLSGFPEHQYRANHNQHAHDGWLEDLVNMSVGTHYLNLDWAERMAVLVENEAMSLRHAHTSDDGVGHTPDQPKLWKRHVFWIQDGDLAGLGGVVRRLC
eukprot:TRINITY_DN12725_c0_g1_i3.p1 TRINITY_DN12725_c0_g1~~TRINITY_DN12725_c0_g1_i3.p1  ORF type:complete len:175 (+),score=28.47 TRINITY_DN12725_c0_g1_i3:286-810(+)